MKKTVGAMMLCATLACSLAAQAAEPSLHEVYQAASSGKPEVAQRMMQEVLQAHPNSGKAHYVEAELLAQQGKLQQAAGELANAERLAPGLPFATPQAVAALRSSLGAPAAHAAGQLAPVNAPVAAPASSGFPAGMLLLGLGLIAFIVWASKLMARRNPPAPVEAAASGYGGYRPAYPAAPYGGAAAYGPAGVAPAAAPGLGSQVLGGLATGAAVGAGVVAGEALLHHFMDGPKSAPASSDRAFSSFDSIPDLPSTPVNDLGGADFGIADTSWDDAGAGGDNDWN